MSKIKIPTSFKLGPHTYKIIINDKLHSKDGYLGRHRGLSRTIELMPKEESDQLDYADTEYTQTYVHELVHGILTIMGEGDLNGSEKFVDLFATFLTQAFETSEYADEWYIRKKSCD